MTTARRLVACLAVLLCAAAGTRANIVFGGPQTPRQPPRGLGPPHSALGAHCSMPAGAPGLCKRIQDCPSLMGHLRSGNIQLLKQLVCGKARSQTLLCCPDGVAPPPPTAAPSPTADTCGITTKYQPPRVVGGEPVQAVGTFPWMVALRYDLRKMFQCGAAVIGRRWLLTAAHCVNIPGGPVGARIGDLNLYTTTDDDVAHPPQDIEVERLIRHPGYRRTFRGLNNDVALVKLRSDIEYSDIVRPICLPTKKSEVQPSGKTVIAGWGLTEHGGRDGTNVMHYAELNITDVRTCQSNYLRSRNHHVDPEQHLCATGNVTARGHVLSGCQPGDDSLDCQGGVDTCKGDSGGPLMSYEKLPQGVVRLTAVGVVSFAIGCGSPLLPGVYTRVDSYIDWIQETMAAHGGR
ncbi:CLIP domain-containing serine protease 14D-like [Amphibalanus amphitrite]|uniref:CLIP domain-containing serine protease 14D-like n=1 Tax=Amphibalanus amphitrite TaxID=1232801 RepID=UPI001C9285DA|nr:CLIP domain-containing serine protease 14D-like [Amphibalanus amphitrite]